VVGLADGVRIEGDAVVLDRFREPDPEVVGLVSSAERPGEMVHRILGVGARAIASASTDLEMEKVERLFDKLSEDFSATTVSATREVAEAATKLLEDDGDLAKMLAAFQEELEGQLADPDSAKSLLSRFREQLTAANASHVKELDRLFDPDTQGSPLNRQRIQTEELLRREMRAVKEQVESLGQLLAATQVKKEMVEKSTQKGSAFEEVVHRLISQVVTPLGDAAELVGAEAGKKVGDVLVTLNPDDTPTGVVRYVLECKDGAVTGPKIRAQLKDAMTLRGASSAVAVFSLPEHAPTKVPFTYWGDQAIVVLDKDDPDERLIQMACLWARWVARREASSDKGEMDAEAVFAAFTKLSNALGKVTNIRRAHTEAKKHIDQAVSGVDEMKDEIQEQLDHLKALIHPD